MRDENKSKARLVEELKHQRERTAQLERLLSEIESSDTTVSERELRYRILSELTSDCCWVRWTQSDGSSQRLWVTDSFERVTGYRPDEFETLGRKELVHPDDLEKIRDYIDGPFGVSQHEFRIIKKDGEVRHLRERMRVVTEGESICVYGATWDITDEKEALEALRRSEERARLIFETALDGVFMMDQSGKILDWNSQASAIFGWDRKQALTKNLRHLVETQDMEKAMGKNVDQILQDPDSALFHARFEWRGIHQSGRIFPLEMSVIPLNRNGGRLLSAFARDLTALKDVENQKKKLEAQMLHLQKLESLGVVAAGIAHDFNNFLTVIMGNAEMAKRLASDQPHLEARHAAILESASNASQLCRQLLTYAGKQDIEFTPLNINHLLEDMKQLMQACVSKLVTLNLSFDQGLPLIKGGPDQIRQIVLNLLTNAAEALEGNPGTITLTTRAERCDQEIFSRCYLNDPLPAGQYVILEVNDTGTGIPPDVIKKMFDPFFTTKFMGRGLGLATVMGIVRSHDGAIQIDSESGMGSTFKVYFPTVEAGNSTDSGQGPNLGFTGNGQRVLVIDDDPDVRAMCRELLDDCGYVVFLADDGRQGMRILKERGKDIDLILLDLNMPGTSGMDTFKEIRKFLPEISVVLMSGYSDDMEPSMVQNDPYMTFIQKPFRRESFLRHVASAITASSRKSCS